MICDDCKHADRCKYKEKMKEKSSIFTKMIMDARSNDVASFTADDRICAVSHENSQFITVYKTSSGVPPTNYIFETEYFEVAFGCKQYVKKVSK